LACPFGSENFLTGTPFYMSPEQVQCFPVDQRSDIYSLGLVVYEMLTGKRPFEGDDHWKVMEMRANQEIPDPAELMPTMPESLRSFIRKACARNPAERYQNIPEVLESLESLIDDYGLTNGGTFKTKRKIRMLYLVYGDEHNNELQRVLDEVSAKMQS
jgi:serine/threonine protein kinase